MRLLVAALLLVAPVLIAAAVPTSSLLDESSPRHPINGRVSNPNLTPDYDCALRAFTVEMAGFIQPPNIARNWTALAYDAFQMGACTDYDLHYRPSMKNDRFDTALPAVSDCVNEVFVDGAHGHDADTTTGTLSSPLRSLQTAIDRVRALRRQSIDSTQLYCITVRGGTYYLGTNVTTTSSKVGAIQLTASDSHLVIQPYENERVVFSGGRKLELSWSVYKKLPTGTIYSAQLPSDLSLDSQQFNELYVDQWRAIKAKWPNGDPATHGLYSQPTGFLPFSSAVAWLPPHYIPSVDVYVATPIRNQSNFFEFQQGVGGGANAFNPPRNFWSTKSPIAGSNYQVPLGVKVTPDAFPNISRWSNPSTGEMSVFHGGLWGSWIFEIDGVDGANTSNPVIRFGRGGNQEARGNNNGNSFAVFNIFEELDDPLEWFVDRAKSVIYLMPNQTAVSESVIVASQIPCILSITGTRDNPVTDVTISGITFTETSSTYFRDYEVPSGGDWSISRSAALYIEGSENVIIVNNNFTMLGGNGVVVSNYNLNTFIGHNEFVWGGDSGIILVGTSDGIDGVSNTNQPTRTAVVSNLLHELGSYIKQSAPIFLALTRNTSIIGNLAFNIPRAAINVNDGFAGGHELGWNVLFNTVRETSDHGPINTWDRQPYLTTNGDGSTPSLIQHFSYIHHNTLFNNYASFYPIDHDDGSCYWEDSYNFQVYGAKKNYLGHSKVDHHELYVFPDTKDSQGVGVCIADQDPEKGVSGWDEVWTNNTCILYSSPIVYNIWNCDVSHPFTPLLGNNSIYVAKGQQAVFQCSVNGNSMNLNLTQWQALGLDLGTTIGVTPDIDTIVDWGRQMLQFSDSPRLRVTPSPAPVATPFVDAEGNEYIRSRPLTGDTQDVRPANRRAWLE